MVSKEEFLEWKQHPVTEAFIEAIKDRITESTEFLVESAGKENGFDNYMRGFIKAYREVLEFEWRD